MITIVDTGGANLFSVMEAFKRLGVPFELTKDHATIQAASKVLLPGVGAAKDSMERLKEAQLVPLLRDLTQPVMGICLGMQLLFEASEEGNTDCLSVIPGKVTKLEPGPGITIPHMGWNQLVAENNGQEDPLLKGILPANDAYTYFVHSFAAPMGSHTLASAQHGTKIPAVVRKDNFWGCQFHPEKSGSLGAQILENFVKL